MTTIGDVTESVSTWDPRRSSIPREIDYIDLSSVDNELKSITSPSKVDSVDAPSRARQLVATGDVLVSTVRPNLNAVAVVPPSLDGATASTGFAVLRPGSEVDGRYLYHWTRSSAFVSDMVRKATGASYPAVSTAIVKRSDLPLPPLEEQRRVAAILDQADALRMLRRSTAALVDELEQSVFFEIFGHPLGNPQGWPVLPISELGVVTTGKTPPTTDPTLFDGPIPFITPGDLESSAPNARSLSHTGASMSRVVRTGATLVCCIGATIGKVGKAHMPSAFNQQINAIEWSSRIADSYGYASMRFRREAIASMGSSTTLPLLPKSRFATIRIPVPPMPLQMEYVEAVRRLGRQRLAAKQQADSMRLLAGSVRGQLLPEAP